MSSLADALGKIGIVGATSSAPKLWLDTGYPVLNKTISGDYFKGLPMGRMVEIFGPPSAGKTVIATNAMISAQKAGGIPAFLDHERSFDSRLAEKLGLDLDPSKFIYLRPRTFEESVDTAFKIGDTIRSGKFGVDPEAPICLVFDSLAAMVPKSKIDKDAADFNMNDNTALARATSAAFPAFSQHCEEMNMLSIFLNQARTKIGVMFGDPTTTPGGQAPEFYSSVRLKLGGGKLEGGAGKRIGCETVKNKVYRPFLKCEWDFVFQEDGSGKMDVIGGVVDHLKELGIIEKAGAYLVWTNGKNYYRDPLVKKIEAEGLKDELFALLPKAA